MFVKLGAWKGKLKAPGVLVLPLFVGGLGRSLPLSQLSFLIREKRIGLNWGGGSRFLGIHVRGVSLRPLLVLTLVL